MLEDEWSPEQIVGHLRRHHSGDDELSISHETIYRSIYTTRWGVIPQKLCKRLRTRRPIRKNKRHTVKGQWRSQIIDARPIEDRPANAEDRSVTGHLEDISRGVGVKPRLGGEVGMHAVRRRVRGW